MHGEMPVAAIEKLPPEVGNRVRAPALIQSLHNAVEELVLNSLDAGADVIEVAVDTQRFSVECRDNGVGIDLAAEEGKLFGKWQCTSKKIESSDTSFGFRGEAVAAISALSSEFGVVSKCKHGAEIRRGSRPVYYTEGVMKQQGQSGTIIRAGNIFGSLIVRQKSMRISKEVARVKEFFTKMSLLHHRVSLSVVSFQHVNGGIKSKTLFRQAQQESVSSMFRSFHGQELASQMVSVDLELHGFRISGLLSPPLSQFCHWTKEYQYAYLGKRWMRGQDFVTHCINRVYTSIFSAAGVTRSGGPAAKHADPAGRQTMLYPMFVLQLTCAAAEYDLLLEPDKTKAVFRREGQLRACLLSLILSMVQHYVPNFPAPEQFVASILEAEGVSSSLLAGFDVEREEEDEQERMREGSGEDRNFCNLPSPVGSAGSASPLTSQYRTAFVPSQSPPQKRDDANTEPPMKKRRTPSFSSLSPSSSSASASPSASPLPSPVARDRGIRGSGEGRAASARDVPMSLSKNHTGEGSEAQYDLPLAAHSWFRKYVNADSADPERDTPGSDHAPPFSSPSSSSREAEAVRRIVEADRQPSPDLSFPLHSPPAAQSRGVGRVFNVSPLALPSAQDGAAKKASSRLGLPIEPVQAMTISKEQLAGAAAIGQVDRKYLLMRMPPPAPTPFGSSRQRQRQNDLGLLVMADQHAVDERIRLESISQPFAAVGGGERDIKTCEVQAQVALDRGMLDAMIGATDTLRSWGFRWEVPSPSSFSSSTKTPVQLTSVPVVHDTALKKADFVEFVSSLASQRLMGPVPSAMCRPPAVTRILASRACRSAIKFGDEVPLQECERLVSQLARTDFPFQCAHGRVSVKPVLPLRALAVKAKKYPSKPRYENLFLGNTE